MRGNIHDVEIADSTPCVLFAHNTADLACFLVREQFDLAFPYASTRWHGTETVQRVARKAPLQPPRFLPAVPSAAQGSPDRTHQLFSDMEHENIARGNDDLLHGALLVPFLWSDAAEVVTPHPADVFTVKRVEARPPGRWLSSVPVGRSSLPSHLWERCDVRLQPVPWRRTAVHASALNAAAARSSAVRSLRHPHSSCQQIEFHHGKQTRVWLHNLGETSCWCWCWLVGWLVGCVAGCLVLIQTIHSSACVATTKKSCNPFSVHTHVEASCPALIGGHQEKTICAEMQKLSS